MIDDAAEDREKNITESRSMAHDSEDLEDRQWPKSTDPEVQPEDVVWPNPYWGRP